MKHILGVLCGGRGAVLLFVTFDLFSSGEEMLEAALQLTCFMSEIVSACPTLQDSAHPITSILEFLPEGPGPLGVAPTCIVRLRALDTLRCSLMHDRRARSTRKSGFPVAFSAPLLILWRKILAPCFGCGQRQRFARKSPSEASLS